MASAFFFRDQIDSAKHYFKKSMSYIDPNNALFDDYYAIIKFTTLLHHLNEYAEEEKLLQQALSQAQKNDNLYQQETILYKLYKNYQLQEDYSNAYSALGMLAQLKEIVDQKKLNLISEVEQSIEERVNVLTMNLGKRESLINYLLIGIVLLVCFALWGFVRSLSPISDSNLVPEISQTQETDYSLNRRRVSIEEINELNTLIKQADPTFLVKFNEYFPLFSEKLNELADPPLNYPEMEICALTKFNYNTKEIAMYRNQSVRSVENRKYRIRKKLNLSPEEDFTLWIAYL